MKKSMLVDGYNLIFASAELRQKMNQKPETARKALMDLCRDYAARRTDLEKFWIVFDGKEDVCTLPPGETGGIGEIYTRAGETADKRIARIVRESEDVISWIVVSNDHAVLDRCYSYGAERMKASAFIRMLTAKTSLAGQQECEGNSSEGKEIHPRIAQNITQEYKKKLGL